MDPFSSARAKITNLARDYAATGDMNEATTRLRIIDRLLFDCLGWHTSEVVAEDYHAGDYVDYALGQGPEVILEAKREGIYFTLPVGLEGRRVVDIQSLVADEATK